MTTQMETTKEMTTQMVVCGTIIISKTIIR